MVSRYGRTPRKSRLGRMVVVKGYFLVEGLVEDLHLNGSTLACKGKCRDRQS